MNVILTQERRALLPRNRALHGHLNLYLHIYYHRRDAKMLYCTLTLSKRSLLQFVLSLLQFLVDSFKIGNNYRSAIESNVAMI